MGKGRTKIVRRKLVAPEWEQQPGEDGACFGKFRFYRQLGPERTLWGAVLAQNLPENEQKREYNRLMNLSQRWEWRERCRLYEKFIDQQLLKDEIKIRRDMNKRLAEHAKSAEVAVMSVIKKFLEKHNNGQINFENLSDKELFFLVSKAADKLVTVGDFERKVRGEPTDIVQTQTSNLNINANYEEMSHEELLKKARELGFKLG
jgi:hypothetical protein